MPVSHEAVPSTPEKLSGLPEGSPAKLRRRLSGDLDLIVLKAMRKEPARRYGSIEQMAEDIRRHLDGLPVTAVPESIRYRAGKFVRRHKAGMAAAALILIAIGVGVAATIREARIAANNGRRAEQRFNDVRKLANSFLFEFHDSIEHLQGSTPARELVVKRALEYLDSLSQESANDPSLQLDLAVAYEKVGSVQGSPYRDNLGNIQGALQSFRKATGLLEQLVKTAPDNQDLRSQLARDYGEIGDILVASGDLKSAMENFRKGLAVMALDRHPNMKTRIRTELLKTHYGMGLYQTGDLVQSAQVLRESIAITDQLIKEDPKEKDNVRDKAVNEIHLAEAYVRMRKLPEALAAYQAAYDLLQSLVEPGNAQSERDPTVAHDGMANVMELMGNNREGLTIHQGVLARDLAAAKADPSDALLRQDIYQDYYYVANAQSRLGEMPAALANQRKAVALNEAEAAAAGASAQTRKDLAMNCAHLGEMLRKAHRDQEAVHFLEKARAIAEPLTRDDPTDVGLRSDLAEIEMNLSDYEQRNGQSAKALAGFQHALGIVETLMKESPANEDFRILHAQLNQKLGEFYVSRDREQARRWLKESSDLWAGLQQRGALGADYADRPAIVAQQIAKIPPSVVEQH